MSVAARRRHLDPGLSKAEPAELRRRLDLRARRFDADAAFPITPEILDAYLTAFEEPTGEGEHVIPVTDTP